MFDAAKANDLLKSTMEKREMKKSKEKWNWLDELQLKILEGEIKKSCKEGCSQLCFNGGYPIRDKVAAMLRENGYKVYVGKINGKVIEVNIEW